MSPQAEVVTNNQKDKDGVSLEANQELLQSLVDDIKEYAILTRRHSSRPAGR
jgi:hypothetical protein